MKIPVLAGTIDRRILVNYHVEADVLAKTLPQPFRPKLVDGRGIAGVCLIRLKHVRPRRLPAWLGFSSENAAHRVAVEWDTDAGPREGVYIPRRDTSSRLNTLVGGRLFPGVHHYARFRVEEDSESYHVAVDAEGDEGTHLIVKGRIAADLPGSSVFGSLRQAADFFAAGSVGYSKSQTDGVYDGLELEIDAWRLDPLAVEHVESSFFDDPQRFPPGSVGFDSALLMHDVEHCWHARGELASPCAC